MPMRVSEPLGRSPGRSGKHMGSFAPVLASLGRLICCGAPCRVHPGRSAAARGHGKPYVASAVQSMLG
jgi:hypothetical protein